MKIALMMENSQAPKNATVLNELTAVASEKNYSVFNVGMSDENDHHLTYVHLGIMTSILIKSKAAVTKENYLDTLRAIDPALIKTAVTGERFQQCFFDNCQDQEIEAFVREILA